MDVLAFRDYCLSLPLTEECTPFDETTLVYKVGGKMYAYADMENFGAWYCPYHRLIFFVPLLGTSCTGW